MVDPLVYTEEAKVRFLHGPLTFYFLYKLFNHHFLKKGNVNVERIKPTVGTIAFNQGLGALIDQRKITIMR